MSTNEMSDTSEGGDTTSNTEEQTSNRFVGATDSMRNIETMVERMLAPEDDKDVLGLGSAVIDDVAWHDFSAYEFLIEPNVQEDVEINSEPDFSDLDLADEVDAAGGDASELMHFLSLLREHCQDGIVRAWSEPPTTTLVNAGLVRYEGRRTIAQMIAGGYDFYEYWDIFVNHQYLDTIIARHSDSYSVVHSYLQALPATVLADLMASYANCLAQETPSSDSLPISGVPAMDLQSIYWRSIGNFFDDSFRPINTGSEWNNIGDAYTQAWEGWLSSELIESEWVKLRDKIIAEFPAQSPDVLGEAASELDRLTVQSLYHEMVQTRHAVIPYPFLIFKPGTYNLGLRLVYRQEWRPLGNQRGEIIRTLPLAPKQSEKISVKITRRLKHARTGENLRSTETASETVDTSKDSTDVTRDVASTFNWNTEAEVSQSWIGGHAKISGGLKGSRTRNTKTNSSFLSESTRKIATKTRTESKVVVNTEAEAQFEISTASELTNPNEEIAVTYVFSKLQKQYEILTRLAEAQNVVMIAEALPEPDEVNYDWVRKHDWIIARVLLDDSYRDALASIGNSTSNPSQGQLGLSLLRLTGVAMDNLGKLAREGGNLSIDNIDFSQEAQRGFREFNKEELERIKENILLEINRQRLYQHIRDNILHYCRAIWSHEDPQQRLLRYRKEAIEVPTEWDFVELDENGDPVYIWDVNTLLDAIVDTGVSDYFYAGDIDGEFRGVGGHVPFHEIINPAGPIGYFGNYSVFYIKPEYAAITANSNLLSALRILQTPYLYYDDSASEGEFMDPVLIQYKSDYPPTAVTDQMVLDVQREMVQFVPALRLEFAIVNERTKNPQEENDSTALKRFWENLALFKEYYAEYRYRDEMSRRLILDTNNLMMDIITGDGTTLEHFKLAHRGIDVLKAVEEKEKMGLENDRRRKLIDEKKLGDPDIEKVTIVTGDSTKLGSLVAGADMGTSDTDSGDDH